MDNEKTFFGIIIGIVAFVIVCTLCVIPIGCGLGWFRDAANTVQQETKPSTLLHRYMWFKDASAALDSRLESIKVYEKRFDRLKSAYGAEPRSKWSRADAEQANVWEQEVGGLKVSYNNLAGEYNSAMAKENWRFTNVGELPAGANQPLPREFKPYIDK